MEERVILNSKHFELTIQRLSHQLIEDHGDFSNTVLVGLQPRGIFLLQRIKNFIETSLDQEIKCGNLDITFYRDDFRRREKPLIPSVTNIDFIIENKKVVLIDDVLFTGRTIRSGLDALMAFGRPEAVQLLALIDRRFKRQVPIQADYVGKSVDTLISERVTVYWDKDDTKNRVILHTSK